MWHASYVIKQYLHTDRYDDWKINADHYNNIIIQNWEVLESKFDVFFIRQRGTLDILANCSDNQSTVTPSLQWNTFSSWASLYHHLQLVLKDCFAWWTDCAHHPETDCQNALWTKINQWFSSAVLRELQDLSYLESAQLIPNIDFYKKINKWPQWIKINYVTWRTLYFLKAEIL